MMVQNFSTAFYQATLATTEANKVETSGASQNQTLKPAFRAFDTTKHRTINGDILL